MKCLVSKGFKYLVALFIILSCVSVRAMAKETNDTADQSNRITEKGNTSKDETFDTNDELMSNDPKKSISSQDSASDKGKNEASSTKDSVKTEYTFEDSKIKVKAVLKKADAVSDQAELKVKEIPENTTEYKKYESALNKKADAYSNVLLYDISFMLNGKEVEPADGSVKVSMEFKNQQLSDDLKVKSASDLKIIHFKDNNVNKQETLQTTTNVKNETTSFETKSFSTYAVANKDNLSSGDVNWTKDFVVLNHPVNGCYVYYFDNTMTNADYTAVDGKDNIKLEYHSITDDSETFTGEPLKTGYESDRILGVLGNFHVVAFDTATLHTHTNGNVLANNLNANVNFGTNNYGIESTYVYGDYKTVHSGSGCDFNNILAVSTDTQLGFYDHGNQFTVNGNQLNKPTIIYRDSDSKKFIDVADEQDKIKKLSSQLASMPNSGVKSYHKDSNYQSYTLNDPDSVGVINVRAKDVGGWASTVEFKGFERGHNGSIIINVDMSDADSLVLQSEIKMKIGNDYVSANEVSEFSAGKIIWNFVNATNKSFTNEKVMPGSSIIAPESNIKICQNINGTIIGKNVDISAESHRSDFTGIISSDDTTFSVSKSFANNVSWPAGTEYTFKFEPLNKSNPMPKGSIKDTKSYKKITVDSDHHSMSFGTINYTYDQSDTSKTISYYYKIYEDKTNPVPNVTYDDNVYYIKVDVQYIRSTDTGSNVNSAKILKTSYISKKDHTDVTDENVEESTYWKVFNRLVDKFSFTNSYPSSDELSLKVNKTDENGHALKGATFTLTKEGTSTVKKVNMTKSSFATFNGLEKNSTYTLTETKAPENYKASGPWMVVTSDNRVSVYLASDSSHKNNIATEISGSDYGFTVDIKNDVIKYGFEINKADAKTKELITDSSATFTLTEVTNVDSSNKMTLANSSTTLKTAGSVTVDNLLAAGKTYYLEETNAPDGYKTNGPWIIVVNDSGATFYTVKNTNGVISNKTEAGTSTVSDENIITYTVSDEKEEYTLPSTGGNGTKTYYMVGTLLSMLGIIYVVFKKGKGGLLRNKKNL